MTLTEIVAKLKAFANSMKLAPVGDAMGFDESDAVWLDAAITHLDPYTQSITPERLEARGFERYREMWQRDIRDSVIIRLYWTAAAGMQAETNDGDQSVLPGVRTLGDVDDLVRMLEGGE